ncbi:MAG: methyl-accepting chemotaxis protein [Gammaproteobacteria bacterium]|nr:methyl-accepting chemotaxis protein [Gammaproteobacteria bacterium]
MMSSKWTLKWKILAGVTVTSTFAVVVCSIIFIVMDLNRLEKSTNTDAQITARLIGANSTGALAFLDSASATETLSSLELNQNISGAVIFDAGGSSFATFAARGTMANSLPNRPGATGEIVRHDDLGYLELYEQIQMDGDMIGTIYLRVSLEAYQQVVNTYLLSVLGIVVGIAAMALAISFVVQRSIVAPINQVVDALRDIAEGDGDLTQRIQIISEDEIGQLAHWFNVFVSRIHVVISSFKDSSFNLTSAAEQLSATTNQTANGAHRQQSEIAHVATAMTEMASTVEEVAHNVGMAASDAQKADNESNKGAEVVAQTMHAINELAHDIDRASEVIIQLQKETDNIGSVLDVIRGIAEQTNLLALNAAIEAARAGEQGRGFAVVADEVRTLASRTQASTEEIQKMIQKLQTGARQAVTVMGKGKEQASSSVEHAGRAGQSLQAITKAVSVIKDMTTQIASASEEQSAVTIDIKKNINNISQVANETATGSKEISAGSDELARLALEMKRLVGQFKV